MKSGLGHWKATGLMKTGHRLNRVVVFEAVGLVAGSLLLGKLNNAYGNTGDRIAEHSSTLPVVPGATRGCDFDDASNKLYYIDDVTDKVYSRTAPDYSDASAQEIATLEAGDTYFGLGVGNGQIAVTNVTDCELEIYDVNTGSRINSKAMPANPKGVAFNDGWEVFIRGPPHYRISKYNKSSLGLERETDSLVDAGMTELGESELAYDSIRQIYYLIKANDSGFYTFNISGSSVSNVKSWDFYPPTNDGAHWGAGFWSTQNRLITTKSTSLLNYSNEYEGYNPPITPTPTPSPSPTPTPYGGLDSLIRDSGDFNGDGTSDVAVFRPSISLWAVRNITRAYLGMNGDIPACGDYDGDKTSDIALFRQSSSLWTARGVTRFYFGGSSDCAVPGDYSGDGICDAGIFRASPGLWSIRNLTRIYFGQSGDIPVPGYFDEGRVKLPALFRPSSGMWAVSGLTRFYFGSSGDIPSSGGFWRGSVTEPSIFRKEGGFWAVRNLTRVYFGSLSDQTVPADYDGNGRDDYAVFRAAAGLWGIRDLSRVYLGQTGDIPISGPICNPVTPTPTPAPSATPAPTASPSPSPTPLTPTPTPLTPTPTPEGYKTPAPSPAPTV